MHCISYWNALFFILKKQTQVVLVVQGKIILSIPHYFFFLHNGRIHRHYNIFLHVMYNCDIIGKEIFDTDELLHHQSNLND